MKAAAFFILLAISGTCFITTGKEKPAGRKLVLQLQHTVGGEILSLGNTYTNCLGEHITIEKFKYYLSNFSVTDDKGRTTRLPVQYFLVNEDDSLSKTISLAVPAGNIRSIRFLMGVDSMRNVSGVQTGALDPLNGMFWTWNSGYIMAKLEGSSEESALPNHYFMFHVGGFRKGQNTARLITLDLPPEQKAAKELSIRAEINQWFCSKSEIRISETPISHTPGAFAVQVANNYSTMFSINPSH
ncbi:MAG: hypothetical protein JWQ78_1273 [Sediminibacterium sp.]|nr:hypothetical protein [Sediminibacterium sp.]